MAALNKDPGHAAKSGASDANKVKSIGISMGVRPERVRADLRADLRPME